MPMRTIKAILLLALLSSLGGCAFGPGLGKAAKDIPMATGELAEELLPLAVAVGIGHTLSKRAEANARTVGRAVRDRSAIHCVPPRGDKWAVRHAAFRSCVRGVRWELRRSELAARHPRPATADN